MFFKPYIYKCLWYGKRARSNRDKPSYRYIVTTLVSNKQWSPTDIAYRKCIQFDLKPFSGLKESNKTEDCTQIEQSPDPDYTGN